MFTRYSVNKEKKPFPPTTHSLTHTHTHTHPTRRAITYTYASHFTHSPPLPHTLPPTPLHMLFPPSSCLKQSSPSHAQNNTSGPSLICTTRTSCVPCSFLPSSLSFFPHPPPQPAALCTGWCVSDKGRRQKSGKQISGKRTRRTRSQKDESPLLLPVPGKRHHDDTHTHARTHAHTHTGLRFASRHNSSHFSRMIIGASSPAPEARSVLVFLPSHSLSSLSLTLSLSLFVWSHVRRHCRCSIPTTVLTVQSMRAGGV